MKVAVDRDGCIECGACEAACPAVFRLPLGEKTVIVERYRSGDPAKGEVGGELESCAREAEESCPVSVIKTGA